MDAGFTSDSTIRRSGFSLDIRSTSCAEADEESIRLPDSCDDTTQEIVVAAGEVLEGTIASPTESDGLYPNRACQEWNIITDANQVHMHVFPDRSDILFSGTYLDMSVLLIKLLRGFSGISHQFYHWM